MRTYYCCIDGCMGKVAYRLEDSKGYLLFCEDHGQAAERTIRAIDGGKYGLVLLKRQGHALAFAYKGKRAKPKGVEPVRCPKGHRPEDAETN